MAINYYLLNGKNGKGNTLNLLVNGKLKRNFIDISTLDLQTMDIPTTNAKEILQEYNPKLDLTGSFYDASYPHNKTETKTYAPIFNFENENTKYYMDNLKYFAEQRNYNKEKGKKVILDENQTLDNYIRTIIYNILNNTKDKLTGYESLMSPRLKGILQERYTTYQNNGTNNFINAKIYILRNLIRNYTELRNLTLEYILYIQGLNTNIRTEIKRKRLWDNIGLTPIPEVEYIKGKEIKTGNYTQMELSEFMDMSPNSKKLKKQ